MNTRTLKAYAKITDPYLLALSIIQDAKESGSTYLGQGCYLVMAEEMIEDQKEWADTDESKYTDFSTSPYWVTTDSGDGPFPITDEQDPDFIKIVKIVYRL